MSSSRPVRVTSLNPVRDAERLGHVVGPSRIASDARNDALRHRFTRLLADGESVAIAAAERPGRVHELLDQVKWAKRGIADDVATLAAAKEPAASERRERLLRTTHDEIAVMAELSTGQSFANATWNEALDALRIHIELLIDRERHDAVVLADIDLALERLEHIEKTAAEALHTYLSYLSAEA